MSFESIINKMPGYAQDIKANFHGIFYSDKTGLSKPQVYGVALALGYALKHEQLLNAIRNEAKMILDEAHFEAAKSACAIMAMNTTYYGFIDMAADKEIAEMSSHLQMSVLNSPGIDKVDYEMYLLAISIVRGCEYCIILHKDKLVTKGVHKSAIHNIARIAAVLKAMAETLEVENLRTYEFFLRGENF